MDHPSRVGIRQSLTNLLEDAEKALTIIFHLTASAEELGQRLPFDEFHGEVRPFVSKKTDLVDGDDPGMLKLAADLGLLQKTSGHLSVATVSFQKHLERDIAPQVDVARLENRPYPAARDLARHLIAVDMTGHLRLAPLSRTRPGRERSRHFLLAQNDTGNLADRT